MAKRLWQPNDTKVGDGEIIGRRIFRDSVLTRQQDRGQEVTIRMDHFYDNRLIENLSVDRLTQSGSPNRKVLSFLRPLANAAQQQSEFYGWGALKVRSLRDFRGEKITEVLATPVVNDPSQSDNPYHADISREDFREKKQAYALAIMLAQMANEDVGIVGSLARAPTPRPSEEKWYLKIIKVISGYARKKSE